jgi:cobalt-zinc-cadmium efflux system outer membrane protein
MSLLKFSCSITACGIAVWAAAAAAAAPLSLPDALAIALQNNPRLKVHAYEARIAEAKVLQAEIKPNPHLSIGIENVLGTGSLSGVKSLETTLQLSQVIDLAGSRAQRVKVASAAIALADSDYETQRINVFAVVARRFTETAADTQRLVTARDARALAVQTLAAAQRRVEAAKSSPLEVKKARTALALQEIEEEHAEHELLVCRQALATAMGQLEPTFGEISADLMTLPDVPDFSELAARLEHSPVLGRYEVEIRWHEAQLSLAQSLRRSGPLVSAGLRRVETSDNFGVVAGVSLPLPLRDQSAGDVRESRERRAQTAAAAEAARLELRSTLFAVFQEMLHARTALEQLHAKIIPAATEMLELSQQGYAEGRYSLLELLDAQKSLLSFRDMVIANATAFHLHVIEIERLLGAPLTLRPSQS